MDPEGTLTAAQLEILELVWDAGSDGASVGEIWEALSIRRPLARTTVLTMVTRLEKRGWLARLSARRGARYGATSSREAACEQLAADFVSDYFDGSASDLVRSLLGARRIDADEIASLRALLDQAEEGR